MSFTLTTEENTEIPNPGSDAALEKGCRCPVIDNARGRGAYMFEGVPQFWFNSDCPLHVDQAKELLLRQIVD